MIVANNKLSNLKCNCLYLNLNNWLEAYCQKGRNVYCTQVVFLSNFYWNRETFHYFDPSNNIIAYHAITNYHLLFESFVLYLWRAQRSHSTTHNNLQ